MFITGSDYHRQTGYSRNRMTPHFLDWDNVPEQFKRYHALKTIPLARTVIIPETDLWNLVADGDVTVGKSVLDLAGLSTLLKLACGYVSGGRGAGKQTTHRTAPSAGALYPCELYLAVNRASGIDPGIYSCNMAHGLLEQIACGLPDLPHTSSPAEFRGRSPKASFVVSGVFFRSAWKYRERAFRYLLLDCGHVVENLVLAARAMGYGYSVRYDGDDALLAARLGIDPKREVCLARIDIFTNGDSPAPGADMGDSGDRKISEGPVSEIRSRIREVSYDILESVYCSGSTIPADTVPDQTERPPATRLPLQGRLPVIRNPETGPVLDFKTAVLSRRSRRNYLSSPCRSSHAMALLSLLQLPEACPFHDGLKGMEHSDIGFLAGAVDGISPGFYLLSRDRKSFSLVRSGKDADFMARICLDQMWLKQAALQFLFLPGLAGLDREFGPRGYRYAMINAGRFGQRLYLGATALGMGCCGIGAFFDDEAEDFLDLADGYSLAYLVAAGPVAKVF